MAPDGMIRPLEPDVAAGLSLAVRFLQAEIEGLRAAGVPVGQDDYRGLYISEGEVERLLGATRLRPSPGPPSSALESLRAELADLVAGAGGRLGRVLGLGRLGAFEAGCLLTCLAGELDPEVERLLAYAQDDVTRRRPRLALLLRLFASGNEGRDALLPEAPLLRHRLVHLFDEPGQPYTALASRWIALDGRIAEYLLGSDALCEPLAGLASLSEPEENGSDVLPAGVRPVLSRLAEDAEGSQGLAAVCGPDPALLRAAAKMVASARGRRLLWVQLPALSGQAGVEGAATLALREAALQDAVLCLEGASSLTGEERSRLALHLASSRAVHPVLVGLTTEVAWPGLRIDVGDLDPERRGAAWASALARHGERLATDIEAVAVKFRLGLDDIRRAGGHAIEAARLRGSDNGPEAADLYAAARAQSTPILSDLARKVPPHFRWEDLVLPEDALDQLREISAQVEHQYTVYEEWGFERKLALSRGVIALFSGNSGTGKTMAADVMANALGLDLYRIDLSAVVSKYIGETEKNLEAIFGEAERSNAILFFDEADALFGKRSEVKDAHDRYANIETAYLLQRMEEYLGVVILATNLKMNLDEAFVRRLHFVVDFPMPDESYRRKIWQGAITEEAPVAKDIDWDFLAKQFKVSGGNIKNAVMAAAFLAAAESSPIGMSQLVRGMRREYQKLGRMVTEAEFGGYTALLRREEG